MNALIALLHFCEVHGPSVVFCTQAIHQRSDLTTATASTTDETKAADIVTTPMSEKVATLVHSLSSTSTTAIIDLPTPPHSNTNITTTTTQTTSPRASSRKCTPSIPTPLSKPYQPTTNTQSSASCAACCAQMPLVVKEDGVAIEAKRMVTTDDEDSSVEYIGTKAPQQLALYKAVRLACVRSLTTEFCPGREGPVLFGDDENGYVMSYMFKLRDAQARGEARFYSLMMLMTDRVFLISCWPFLVSSFRSMAINLQERADIVFQREKETRPQFHPFAATSRRVGPMSQEQFFRRRSNTALRSLTDLLGVKDIYPQIHAQFSYILKLSARRRMEKITPGRSASAAYLKMVKYYIIYFLLGLIGSNFPGGLPFFWGRKDGGGGKW
ncbi:vesicle coat protein [Circinella umbellata]|nr:vesicle coat protein [Circinella umbellata]